MNQYTRGRLRLKKTCVHFLRLILPVRFVAKRHIPQHKCLRGQIGTCVLGTRWNNFYLRTPTLRATIHSVTDRQTDGQQAAANSRSYCVAVRSAKNCALISHTINNVVHHTAIYATCSCSTVHVSVALVHYRPV